MAEKGTAISIFQMSLISKVQKLSNLRSHSGKVCKKMFCFVFLKREVKLGFETRFSYPRTCTFILPTKQKPTCGAGSALS